MIYKGTLKIEKDTFFYYKNLLLLDLEKDTFGYGKQDDFIHIGTINFKNGTYMTFDLASGKSNYYDNIVLYDKNNNELLISECLFEIASFELFYGEDIYKVKLIIT